MSKKWIKIRNQVVETVNKTVVHPVRDDLLQKVVPKEEELEKIMKQSKTLLDSIKKESERVIKRIHSEEASSTDDLRLMTCLEGSPVPDPPAMVSVEETQPVESRLGIKLCPPNVFEKIQREESDKIYPIIRDTDKRTRLALIICNIDFESDCFPRRDGAEEDLAGMERLLTGLEYTVEVHTNLCSKGMADCLREFAARDEHKTSDSTFVVLMSHGLRAGLCGLKSQGENLDILSHDTIYSILNNRNCPGLRNKPKVIIIQACRGENKGVVYVSTADALCADSLAVSPAPGLQEDCQSDAIRRMHVESDFICFCSTTPDNISWRSPQTGSVFIVQLINQIQEHAWHCHLEEIFREVTLAFKNNLPQMPSKERVTLLKRFYLFPGY